MRRDGQKATGGYSVESNPRAEWVTTEISDDTVTVTVQKNTDLEERTEKIVVTGDSGKPVEVTVTQAGAAEE